MGAKTQLNDVIDKVSVLNYEEQEIVLDVLKYRHIERRREMILENSRKTLREYKAGHAKAGTSRDLLEDMEND